MEALALASPASVLSHPAHGGASDLSRVPARIFGLLDPDRLVRTICTTTADAVGASVCELYLDDGEGGNVVLVSSVGRMEAGTSFEASRRAERAAHAAHTGTTVTERLPEASLVAAPVVQPDGTRGALVVVLGQGAARQEATPGAVTWIAELCGVALHSARVHADVSRLARIDYLSGCVNRAALHEALRAEIECARRDRSPLSVLLIDLNDFKAINDTQGHEAGDRALRLVGAALQLAVRPGDVVARYGGDEFAIVLPHADAKGAAVVGQRAVDAITDAIRDPAVGEADGQAAVAGAAQWAHDAPADLIHRADRALLFAKRDKRAAGCVTDADVPEDFFATDVRRATDGEPPTSTRDVYEAHGDRIRQRSQQLMVAAALGNRLAGLREAKAIVQAVVSEVYHGLGYYHCCICRLRADGDVERVAGSGAAFDRRRDLGRIVPAGDGIVGRTLRTRQTQLVHDIALDPDFSPDPAGVETRSELAVPVIVGGELWGALNIEERRRHAFDEHDVRLLEALASQLGAALSFADRAN